MKRDTELLHAGFERQATYDEPRLGEMVALYRELGFEVEVAPPPETMGCGECLRAEPGRLMTIYTRKRPARAQQVADPQPNTCSTRAAPSAGTRTRRTLMETPRKIGVVGAGTMGAGIAQKIAQSGMQVVLMDIGPAQLEAGLGRIRSMLEEGVRRKVFPESAPAEILGRIEATTDAARMQGTDLVIEAVFEDLSVKRKLFAAIEPHVGPETVLATNTSSFKVAALAEGAERPERYVGLHYFYHPAKNRLLEVIPHRGSSAEAVQRAWLFAESHGKTAIHAADAPGFVVNRFFVPWLNESVRLLEEGQADLGTIEAEARALFGIGMGPFELMNVTGVPIALHAADGLALELGTFYRAAELLRKQVASKQNWELKGPSSGRGREEVRERLMGVVLLVAATLVEEGVSSAEDTEIGAKVGLRWPFGPFSLANQQGLEWAVRAAALVSERYHLPLPRSLAERLQHPRPFEIRQVCLEVEDGLARITMNRPEALNALDPTVVDALAEAFHRAEADPAVRAIVIEGRGKAFVAGADIKFFVQALDAGDIDRIIAFTRRGHELFLAIDRCAKPVVARLNGLALGGGAELALAADAIVADEGAALGFPETGIGIYPGLGGTQRLVKRTGLGVARYLVMTGEVVGAAQAAELGLIDRVAPTGTSLALIRGLLAEGAIRAGEGPAGLSRPGALAEAYAARMSDATVQALLDGSFAPADPASEKLKKRIAQKAPVALRIAHRLMNAAETTPIAQGIELELGSLREIFSTEDARSGLGSVGRGRPAFQGR